MLPAPPRELDEAADTFLALMIEDGWSGAIEAVASLPWLAGLTLIESSVLSVRRYGFTLALTAVSQTTDVGALATVAHELRSQLLAYHPADTSLRYLEGYD